MTFHSDETGRVCKRPPKSFWSYLVAWIKAIYCEVKTIVFWIVFFGLIAYFVGSACKEVILLALESFKG